MRFLPEKEFRVSRGRNGHLEGQGDLTVRQVRDCEEEGCERWDVRGVEICYVEGLEEVKRGKKLESFYFIRRWREL